MSKPMLGIGLALAALGLGLMTLTLKPSSAAEAKPAATADKGDPEARDHDLLQQSAVAFCEAFNRGDAKAVAALWTEDGDYVDEAGQRFAGRQAIAKEYARFFASHPGTKIQTFVDSIRIPSQDMAIEDGRAILDPAPEGPPAMSRYMAVHVKVDGKWKLSTVRDTRVETPSTYSHLEHLAWLIGSWRAEQLGATMNMNCRWVANKSFIERSYSVTKAGEVLSSGVQVIGWDPSARTVRSWTFAAGCGYASGAWTPKDNGWAISTSGTAADGTPTRAVNLLTIVDADAVTWRSVDRVSGDVRLADEDEVLLRRVNQ